MNTTLARRPDRRRWSSERGAELVEFALTLPLLLIVFGGIVDFGLILQRQQVLSNAAREGARLAVLPGYTQPDVDFQVTRYVRVGFSDDSANPVVQPFTVTTVTPPSGPPFDVVRVDVAYTSNFLVLGRLANLAGGNWTLGSQLTLRAASTMRIETISGS
jgi:Flp pilus assembly protein TadG